MNKQDLQLHYKRLFFLGSVPIYLIFTLHMGANPSKDGNYFSTLLNAIISILDNPFKIALSFETIKYGIINLIFLCFSLNKEGTYIKMQNNIDKNHMNLGGWFWYLSGHENLLNKEKCGKWC